MRGLGQLSDAEGKKITAAYTRATNPKQSEIDAKKAWKEVLKYLDLAEMRAKQKAGVSRETKSENKGSAPQKAIDYLMKNNTPAVRKQFKDKYGYLPNG
jgi:hypothetical protein